MKLTINDLHSIGTTNGSGFNSAQLTLLGVTDPSKGWLRRLARAGVEVSDETWQKLKELKGASVVKQKEIVPERMAVWRYPVRLVKSEKEQTLRDCREQFKRLVECWKAGEKISAQDHARQISALLGDA